MNKTINYIAIILGLVVNIGTLCGAMAKRMSWKVFLVILVFTIWNN